MALTTEMSPRARTVLEAMRNADIVGEEKATDMDHILKLVRMPKGQLSEALHELVSRKLVRHIAHHKAARYCATPP